MSEDTNKKVRLYVFVGAYGSGKSEVSVHFAHKLKKEDPSARVMLADLDIVNPYYRSADAKDALEAEGIHVIVPEYANTNVDVPALSGEVYSAFD
jgi:Mrp family chromosome partitioning ATPase